ncbi:MAG: flavodoxin-dependent (E)-4-hydroxy-3-methylbut-2-enyl-diphosphate synthase [Erysipelotrichales bacterium]|nr:flavodoxin-dependent (E)-4-hydroxy-3-methylbut-2-enyl-diphosphate synthase [Erysipelotrichales bacterium]
MKRKITRTIPVGDLTLGGGSSILIQSMTNTKTSDVEGTVAQIKALQEAGCQLVRMAISDMEDAVAVSEIKKLVEVPLIGDIHFDHRLALAAIKHGIDKIRLNPGNIEKREHVAAVVEACKERHIPIRIGINSGSIPKDLLNEDGGVSIENMMEAANRHVRILEEMDFYDIALSFKCSDVSQTIDAYRRASEIFPYPLHLGVTEAGTFFSSSIKSAIAIGALLHDGIGDTLRVSVSGDPVEEIRIAKSILNSLRLLPHANLVSCPTCGRTKWDLIPLAKKMEEYLANIPYPITVAIMGCVVNGPGEARHADIGIAGGNHEGLLFKHGEIVRKLKEEEFETVLKEEIHKIIQEKYL